MRIRICSADSDFVQRCQAVLAVWNGYLGEDTDIQWIREEASLLEAGKQQLVLVDADSFRLSEEGQQRTVQLTDALFICSRNSQQAIQSYRLRPTAFLKTPFTAGSLGAAMNRCVPLWRSQLQNLEVTENRVRVKMPLCELLWLEAMGHRSVLHGIGREVQASEALSDLEEQLPESLFIRCQRSYVVNLYHIQKTDGKSLWMTDGSTLTIGRGNRADVLEALEQFWKRLQLDGTE